MGASSDLPHLASLKAFTVIHDTQSQWTEGKPLLLTQGFKLRFSVKVRDFLTVDRRSPTSGSSAGAGSFYTQSSPSSTSSFGDGRLY